MEARTLTTNRIKTRKPDDWHVHFRWAYNSDGMLYRVFPYTACFFGRALLMPNLTDMGMVVTAEHLIRYRKLVQEVQQHYLRYCKGTKLFGKFWTSQSFMPEFSIRLTPKTTSDMLLAAKVAGAIVAKVYPDGVTTGSEGGISDFKALHPLLQAAAEIDLPVSWHPELPGAPPLTAEQQFIPVLSEVVSKYPGLRIVIEHLSSQMMVDFVWGCPKTVAATITPQHLILTANDVFGQPHNFCKPVAKLPNDREAVIAAAISGDPRFFFGSDTAPHPRANKEGAKAAAGVFSAPALSAVIQVFEENHALDKLEDFWSRFGAEFYGFPLNQETIEFVRESWEMPLECSGIVPFLAGKTLDWQVESVQ
ncbi:MAG: amidohydrolase family protein [Patescibacteria group bacterium]